MVISGQWSWTATWLYSRPCHADIGLMHVGVAPRRTVGDRSQAAGSFCLMSDQPRLDPSTCTKICLDWRPHGFFVWWQAVVSTGCRRWEAPVKPNSWGCARHWSFDPPLAWEVANWLSEAAWIHAWKLEGETDASEAWKSEVSNPTFKLMMANQKNLVNLWRNYQPQLSQLVFAGFLNH